LQYNGFCTLHKYCHLLIFGCKIGDFKMTGHVCFQKKLYTTYCFYQVLKTIQMAVQVLHCIKVFFYPELNRNVTLQWHWDHNLFLTFLFHKFWPKNFQQSLFLRIITLLTWLKSTLLLKKKCFDTQIYMKAQCLQANETQHYCGKENAWGAGWVRKRVALIKSLIILIKYETQDLTFFYCVTTRMNEGPGRIR